MHLVLIPTPLPSRFFSPPWEHWFSRYESPPPPPSNLPEAGWSVTGARYDVLDHLDLSLQNFDCLESEVLTSEVMRSPPPPQPSNFYFFALGRLLQESISKQVDIKSLSSIANLAHLLMPRSSMLGEWLHKLRTSCEERRCWWEIDFWRED